MPIEDVLHLDRRDVLSPGDDDVLAAVSQLDVAVRVQHADVARMEPAAAKGLGGRLRIAVVAAHDVVAAHHDLAQGGPVIGDIAHLLVDDPHVEGEGKGDTLA